MVQKSKTRSGSRSRRRGYRGYGSGHARQDATYGGAVHWGTGFSGVAFPAGPSETLSLMRNIAEERRDRNAGS